MSAALLIAAAGAPSLAQSQTPPRPGQLPPPGGKLPPPQRSQPLPPPQTRTQQPQPQQQTQQKPQQQPAVKPYKAVAIKAPEEVKDPSFEAFRKKLGEIAEKKDRRALAGLVAKNFFWMGEKGDKADKKKPGIDNLAKAIELDAKEGYGWDVIANYADDPTAAPDPDHKDTICAPAEPDFNGDEFEALLKATSTDDGDWAFPVEPDLEMHAAALPTSPVVEKLGMHFVRVLEDESAEKNDMVKVVSPSGKTGYVPSDEVSALGNDEMCYVKEAGAWKIAGVTGGE